MRAPPTSPLHATRAPRLRGLPGLLVALEIGRAHSAAGAGLAVWVGAHLAGAAWHPGWLAPMAVAALLSAAGNADNDAHDAPLDQINRPTRPIPRGAATPAQARRLAVLCAGAALLLALPGGAIPILGTLAAILGFHGYTRHLKAAPLLGNTLVGALAGMALGYGGLLAGDVPAVLLPGAALVAFFTGRELLKTIYDLPGDSAFAIATAATRWGARPTLTLATALCGVAAGLLGAAFGTQAAAVSLAALALTLFPLWHHPEKRSAAARVLVWSKVLGLAALVAMLG